MNRRFKFESEIQKTNLKLKNKSQIDLGFDEGSLLALAPMEVLGLLVDLQFRIQLRSCRGRCGEWWPAGSGCGCLARPGLWFLCWPLVLCVPCAHCPGLCVGVCSTPLATAARHARTCAGCMRTGSKLRFCGFAQGYSWATGSQGSLLAQLEAGGACLPAAPHGVAPGGLVSPVRGAAH